MDTGAERQNAGTNQINRHISTCARIFYAVMLFTLAGSLLLQIIGLVTPGWLVLDFNIVDTELKFSMGLWYVNYCSEGTCGTEDLTTFWDKYYTGPKRLINHEMTEFQIETVLAAICTVVAMVCVLKILFCSPNGVYKNKRHVWTVTSGSSALAGILAIVAAARYGQRVQEAHDENSDPGPSPFGEPWSLIITGVGGILASLVCVAMMCETLRVSAILNQADRPQIQDPVFTDLRRAPWTPAPSTVTPRQVLEYDPNYRVERWKTKY